jgi:hypothetical protein
MIFGAQVGKIHGINIATLITSRAKATQTASGRSTKMTKP